MSECPEPIDLRYRVDPEKAATLEETPFRAAEAYARHHEEQCK
jgi:hypothetical protein